MIIDEASLEDAGTYTLCAKNLSGIAYTSCDVFVDSPVDKVLNMTVESEAKQPVVVLPLKDTTTIEGGTVQMDCVISSFPEPGSIHFAHVIPVDSRSSLCNMVIVLLQFLFVCFCLTL